MNDWKRAGNVSFGSGVRCKQFNINGAQVTVYCDQAEIDRVEEALSLDAIKVQRVGEKNPIFMVGNGDSESTIDDGKPWGQKLNENIEAAEAKIKKAKK